MLARDFMTKEFRSLSEENTIAEAVKVFLHTRLDAAPVVDNMEKLVGVFTKHNLYRALGNKCSLQTKINSLMITNVLTVRGDEEFSAVYRIMLHHGVGSAVVIDAEQKPIGIVTKVDLIRTLQEQTKSLAGKLRKQVSYYRSELSKVTGTEFTIKDIISVSPEMEKVKVEAKRAALGFSTILLLGESGTGKELFAKAIHSGSRPEGPFIKVNCAAVPENLLETEFFGYEEGAFTGAKRGGKPGKFELADGGSLFLDEIGDMSPHLQVKLLRVLQEREFERVGGIETIRVNVRIIAATNKDLEKLVTDGNFREDLYYRLNVITLSISPLRKRLEDVRPLSNYFINRFQRIMGSKVMGITDDVLDILEQHHWPGNTRELENVIERAMNLIFEGKIEVKHLAEYLTNKYLPRNQENDGQGILQSKIQSAEKKIILDAIRQANGNRTQAAKLLGISRSSFYEKINKYQI
ncbi:sigma 54-interacting transcriptional regulator [Metallumcola ferriviriculae]|uniref:Sigma 54-interacting transcriptional regulator n=1 Tax=Metallumcola ferriviriculae TaxID=3039180 RepID=A0AAU0URJ0_9FIRM|nr:sigma 54-interacting transcriptional regulator [Desulfitibacteraceae bacterium MK1]